MLKKANKPLYLFKKKQEIANEMEEVESLDGKFI